MQLVYWLHATPVMASVQILFREGIQNPTRCDVPHDDDVLTQITPEPPGVAFRNANDQDPFRRQPRRTPPVAPAHNPTAQQPGVFDSLASSLRILFVTERLAVRIVRRKETPRRARVMPQVRLTLPGASVAEECCDRLGELYDYGVQPQQRDYA